MTNKEAIDLLDNLLGTVDDNHGNDYDHAIHMAMDALAMDALANTDTDTISRQAALDAIRNCELGEEYYMIESLPSAQPTLYGYNIEHLKLIARVLQKENLPPERIVEVLTDIGRIVAIVRNEFEESLRKAAEQCKM